MLSAPGDSGLGRRGTEEEQVGVGGYPECVHSIHTQPQLPFLPTWEQWGLWLPTQPEPGHARRLPHTRLLRPLPFSRLIPQARLMNNVIKGAITLFLNAF